MLRKRIIIVLMLLFFVPLASAEDLREVDTNGDGKPDQWLYIEGANLVKMEEDFDFDGSVDKRAVFFYKDGQKVRVEIDSNMDGKADGWSYHRNHRRYLVQSDTNYDGVADYVIDNDQSVTTIDSNYDGTMDIQESKEGRLLDVSGDGKFTKKVSNKLDLEAWLEKERSEYFHHLQQYMKNTNYKKKAGLE